MTTYAEPLTAVSPPRVRVSRRWRRVRNVLTAYSFIAPNFIGFAVFTLGPIVFAFALAFMHWDGSNPIEFAGLDNFWRLFSDKVFQAAFWNTIIYTGFTVPLTLVCSLGLAILLNQKIFGRNFFRTVAFFPYVASLIAVAVVWNMLFNPDFGPVNMVLYTLGVDPKNLPGWAADRHWAMVTVIMFSVWKNMGYFMVIYLAGLQGISAELYEAAEHRRRHRLAEVLVRHPAAAGADHLLRLGDADHQVVQGVRPDLHDHAGRAGNGDPGAGLSHLQRGLRLLGPRLFEHGGPGPVPARPRHHRRPVPLDAREGGGPGMSTATLPTDATALKRPRRRVNWGLILTYVIVILITLTMLAPFVWMLSASLKLNRDVFAFPIEWIPSHPRWQNYVDIWTKIPLALFIYNTFKLTVIVTILQLLTSSFAAYAFAKLRFPYRNALFLAYIATIAMPWQVYMVPQFIMMRGFGLNNTLTALICLQAFTAFGVFLMRQFYMSIPDELCEAARIDGMSEYGIWWRIMLPLSMPAISTLTIFTFVTTWNDFLGPLIYLTKTEVKTIQIGIRMFITQYTQEYGLIMAASVVSLIPVLILFLALQRFFVEGIASTGLKG